MREGENKRAYPRIFLIWMRYGPVMSSSRIQKRGTFFSPFFLFIGDSRCGSNTSSRGCYFHDGEGLALAAAAKVFEYISVARLGESDSACAYTPRRFVTSDREDRSPRLQAKRRAACHTSIATGSRWRTTATANYSRAASTFVAQRSTLFSVHPENSTRFPRMVTHIWYLSEGIVIDISPDIRDAERRR